jgi:hypothetical protein
MSTDSKTSHLIDGSRHQNPEFQKLPGPDNEENRQMMEGVESCEPGDLGERDPSFNLP